MEKKKEKNILPLGMDLLESLAKFQQIELEDVEISFDELEIRITPGMIMGAPQASPPSPVRRSEEHTSELQSR